MIMYLIEISNSSSPVYLSEIKESRNKTQFLFSTDIEDALRYGTHNLASDILYVLPLKSDLAVVEHEF